MMKRTCGMVLRFTKAEMDALTKKARKAHMSREGFCRSILNGATVREAPSIEWASATGEFREIGNALEQILARADADDRVDGQSLKRILDKTYALEDKLFEFFTAAEN